MTSDSTPGLPNVPTVTRHFLFKCLRCESEYNFLLFVIAHILQAELAEQSKVCFVVWHKKPTNLLIGHACPPWLWCLKKEKKIFVAQKADPYLDASKQIYWSLLRGKKEHERKRAACCSSTLSFRSCSVVLALKSHTPFISKPQCCIFRIYSFIMLQCK